MDSGCKVVEQLTRVPPLVFDGMGLLFFQMVYWCLWVARGEQRRVPSLLKTILLVGLAVEAVLISFQYLVAQAFCVYCLVIFAGVVLLNLLLGLRQTFAGLLIFAGAALAFASLDLNSNSAGKQFFSDGVFARRPGVLHVPEQYLFYSSSCAHCEKVIASLKDNATVTIAFNPIDKVAAIDLPQVTYTATYTPSLNKALLHSLGINEIPVLLTRTQDGWVIRQGEAAILDSLQAPVSGDVSGQSGLPDIPIGNDGCGVSGDCTGSTQVSTPMR